MPILELYFYFVLFFALIIYYMIPQKRQWYWLLAISLIAYYLCAGWKSCLLMLFTAVAVWFGALKIQDGRRNGDSKIWFIITLLVAGGSLFYINYLNFFIRNANVILGKLGSNSSLILVDVLKPLGLSFYILNLLSYLIDVYWSTQEAEKNCAKILLFTCYFPTITTGPFIRFGRLSEGLFGGHTFRISNLEAGGIRILWGLFKKMTISDYLSVVVGNVYMSYWNYTGWQIMIATFLATIQLYMNFSASIDIVIGISRLFGIILPENFNYPFMAISITELFRRWHMTLGEWLKDYIYFPLMKSGFVQGCKNVVQKFFGKRAGKKTATFLAMFLMWYINGFWHGATWNYIVGVCLGLWFWMLLEGLAQPWHIKLLNQFSISPEKRVYKFIKQVWTFIKLSTVMVFFETNSFLEGCGVYGHMVSKFIERGTSYRCLTNQQLLFCMMSLFIFIVITSATRLEEIEKYVMKQRTLVKWSICYMLILSILMFSANGTDLSEGFIYAYF